MKRAFTLVEIMIVIVIVGILAAMFIPALQRVRFDSIEKRIIQGRKIDADELRYYNQYKRSWGKVDAGQFVEAGVTSSGEVTINGVTYYLIKK